MVPDSILSQKAGSPKRLRLLVLASGTGSLTQALIETTNLRAEIVAVGADRPAPVLAIAEQAGLPTFQINPADFSTREAWDQALASAVAQYRPDLVVSAGFMRLLGSAFLTQWGRITINTHPALLPNFPGAQAVRDALAAGVAVSGCTVHRVIAEMDAGPILAQRRLPVLPGDDESSLHERIKTVERNLLVEVINHIALGAIVLA